MEADGLTELDGAVRSAVCTGAQLNHENDLAGEQNMIWCVML